MNNILCVKKVDSLGRIVLPTDIRHVMDIRTNDMIAMAYSESGRQIIIEKVNDSCMLCHGTEHLTEYGDKHICKKCLFNLMKTIEQSIPVQTC